MARNDYSWLDSRTSYLIRLLISLALTYAFASLAIDTGRWLHYFLTIVCVALSVKFAVKFITGNGKRK